MRLDDDSSGRLRGARFFCNRAPIPSALRAVFNEPRFRARWIGACSVFFLAACGSGQTNPKSFGAAETATATESTPNADSTANPPANAPGNADKKTEVAGSTPSKAGSGSTEAAGEKPYQLTLFQIERPPFAHTLKIPVKVNAGPAPTLTKVSETKNKITDELD